MKEILLRNGDLLKISVTQPDDAPQVLDYLSIIGGETDYLSFGKNNFGKSIKEEKAIITEFLEKHNHLHIIAEIGGELVSLLDVSGSEKDRLRHSVLFGISVKKKHWGKGIATEMINYMLEWAKATKMVKKINLQVVSNNEQAINLYRKFDFSMEGRITKSFSVNGTYLDMIHMGYWID